MSDVDPFTGRSWSSGGGGGGEATSGYDPATNSSWSYSQQRPARYGGGSSSSSGGGGGMSGAERENQQSARLIVSEFLTFLGLPELDDFAWQMIRDGASAAEVQLRLRQHDVYKTRFAGNEGRRQRGMRPLSEAEYIAYEEQVRQTMRAAGMPRSFYDGPEDIEKFMVEDLSVNEVISRINSGYARVASAPPAVRAAFAEFYGVEGDAALAMFFLSPDRATPILERQIEVGFLGGRARQFGLDLSKSRAEELFDKGISAEQAIEGFRETQRYKPVFNELIGESEDLTADHGIGAFIDRNFEDEEKIRRRIQSRTNKFRAMPSGGAAMTEEGVVGLGRS